MRQPFAYLIVSFAFFAACSCGSDKPAPVSTFGGGWPDQVDSQAAEADGLTAADFDFEQWPVSEVRLTATTAADSLPAFVPFVYRCQIPATAPQADQYDAQGEPLPDPVGLALAWVRFELRDADNGDVLDGDDRGHTGGNVEGIPPRSGGELWTRLTPGSSLRVQLFATPVFYYLAQDGGDRADYAATETGYFHGAEIKSPFYLLTMNQDGEIAIEKGS